MSNYPTSFEAARAAVVAFLKNCEGSMEKLRDREMLKEEIGRLTARGGNIGSGLRNTGIMRRVDELGRMVIPMEMRRVYDIPEGQPMEIFLDEEAGVICLQKYNMHTCVFCRGTKELTTLHDKEICEDCIEKLFRSV